MSRTTFFSSLEISEAVRDIHRSAKSHRLNNFYDVGTRTFVMRFGAADSKHRVAFEPGVRLHLTDVDHEKPKLPSHFTLLIRRHIKGWRLFSCTQVGTDRVVDMAFGSADTPNWHVFIELWGQGNIILTDGDCKILAFWRTPRKSDNLSSSAAPKQIGDVYLDSVVSVSPLPSSPVEGAAAATAAPTSAVPAPSPVSSALTEEAILVSLKSLQQQQQQQQKGEGDVAAGSNKKGGGGGKSSNQQPPVGSVFPHIAATYGPMLLKHISMCCAVDFSKPLPANAHVETLARHLARSLAEVDAAYSATSPAGGIVFCKKEQQQQQKEKEKSEEGEEVKSTPPAAATSSQSSSPFNNVVGFAKLPLKQFSAASSFTAAPTPTFSAAADALYAEEERKKIHDINRKVPTAESREARTRAAIQRRMTELESEGGQRRRCANALLLCAEDVDSVVQLIGDALALGTPWKALTDAIRRQREDAEKKGGSSAGGGGGAEKKKHGAAAADDDDDDDDDAGGLFGSDDDDDSDNGGDLFVDDDDEQDETEGEDDEEEQDDDNDERNAAARSADEQRYLLSLIYALDLRRNQMTLQLPDPEAVFDEHEDDDDDEGTEQTILVAIDLGLSSHENATKYFEAAKKADRSRQKTADREEDAVASAKKTIARGSQQHKQQQNQKGGSKKAANNLPKQLAAADRTPTWFERYLWFITSSGDLVLTPKDAGQADVLMTKFADLEFDAVVMHDGGGSASAPVWPTLVKTRRGALNFLEKNSSNNNNSNNNGEEDGADKKEATSSSSSSSSAPPVKISTVSLREAGASCVCRSAGWQQKSAPRAYWCAAAALTKVAPGTKDKQLPQGQWHAPNETRTPLEVFSLQMCVAVVEARSMPLQAADFEPVEGSAVVPTVGLMDKVSSPAASAAAAAAAPTPTPVAQADHHQRPQPKQHQQQQQQQNQQSEQAAKHQQKKAAKIAKKYGEQDEDDRAIALALIGTKKSKAHELLDRKKNNSHHDDDDDESEEEEKPQQTQKKSGGGGDDASKQEQQQQQQGAGGKAKKGGNPRSGDNPRVGGGKAGGGSLSEDAAKNLNEKMITAAQDWLTMRVLGTAHCDAALLMPENEENLRRFGAVRFVAPVCVPVLAMPTNKVRVLIVPGGEKRNGLTVEIARSFFAALATHIATPMPGLSAALGKILNDDLLQQLPATGKIQTPFRASMVHVQEAVVEKKE